MKCLNLICAAIAVFLVSCEKPPVAVPQQPPAPAAPPSDEELRRQDAERTAQRAAESDKLLREGERYATAGDADKAFEYYQAAVKAHGLNASANLALGRELLRRGKDHEAAVRLNLALRVDPSMTEALVALGDVYAAKALWAEAAAHYGSALSSKPNDGVARHKLGLALAQQGQLEKAADELEAAAAATQPGSAEILSDLGYLYAQQRRQDEAIGVYKRALASAPDVADTRVRLGAVYADAGRLEEAEAEFKEALRLDEKNGDARVGLGRVQLGRGETEQAVETLRHAAGLNARSFSAHYYLGKALEGIGKTEEAAEEYEVASQLDSRSGSALLALGNLLSAQGKYEEAERQTYSAVQREGSAEAHFAHGINLACLNRREDARKHLEKALELDPTLAVAREELDKLK